MTQKHDNLARFHAIIPAGGIGSRLWPLSRASAPKFLHDLTGSGQTLLQDTWDRIVPLTGSSGITVVTGQSHRKAVVEQLEALPQQHLLLEPSPKDSTAAIALAAAVLFLENPDVIIGSFAADHVIHEDDKFRSAVRKAIEIAASGRIVTIGVNPTEPSTAFGYIKKGKKLEEFGFGYEVKKFVEKPKINTARKFVLTGNYFWNAGMFIAPAKLLLEVLSRTQPRLHAEIMQLAQKNISEEFDAEAVDIWNGLEKVAIDYSIAEPAAAEGLVAVVPADFEWHDVGDFASIAELQANGRPGNLAVLGEGRVLSDSSSGILVNDTGRLIALIGVEDIIVVDTPDALLVTTKAHAQKVKGLVESLKANGQDSLL